MCRLLGYVTRTPEPVEGSLGRSLFDRFTSLSALHGDGWGMGWLDDADRIQTRTAADPAALDPAYADLAAAPLSRAGLVHLRWATDGLAVQPSNTHPFHDDRLALAHNGSIAPIDRLEAELTEASRARLAGTTDSERYFAFVRQALDGARDETLALCTAIGALRTLFPAASLNAIALTPSHLYVVHVNSSAPGPIDDVFERYADPAAVPLGHHASDAYFGMWFRVRDDAIHAVSSGLPPDGFRPIPVDSVLAIDLARTTYTVHDVAERSTP